jgi:ribonuclease P protein component
VSRRISRVPDERLLRQYRLRRRGDFQRVQASDVFAADQVLVVRGCENGLPYPRLGLAVSRQVGSAVVRNRWKRLIREAFRRCRARCPAGCDFVVRPRRGARPDYPRILTSLPRLASQVAQRLSRPKP